MSDSNKNLIIVSNRLPVSVSKVDGKLVYSQSSGGLATGLSSVAKAKDSLWIGWPGISLEETTKNERLQITRELKKRGCNPVFLSKDQIENYYSGYSNGTLWPLFHYTHDKVENIPIQWEAYKEVNQLFCDTVTKQINGSSTVWVHDYHLMKLPALLREQKPATKIGFFLHTPFPSYEIFRLLPERIEVIEGLMGADLIGFHTYDYVRHFNSTILRLLGYEESAGKILAGDRQISVEVYPIGIDYQKFSTYKPKPGKSDIGSMKQFGSGMKTLLSFDRADYSKGIPERLAAFEHFLNKYPEYHKKVVLLVIVAPSRVDVEAYQNLQEEIDIKISHINGTYSTVDWAPISYIYRDLDFDEVVRAYKGSDVMLVTPLRDGMNLMAKEFIATKQNGNGVLILSELAGAASEMLEAVLVNPADKDMVAEAIYKALKMPASEQASRLNRLHERIAKYTVQKWAKDFVSDLKLLSLEQAE
ncbi:MAG: bifunctional alpha,alpha-trehalose-phosphate synthase (UDP-forming)/trehalose-phosphatase, partial [Candidatus Saccharimonadales bacterium]|nr:bifunctional alpha,alpha-trehalose-phosphate synthase (UDP-forming)/trehalose-phosphatase [Candidatus Saccharimonadales bacterium]